MVIDGCVTLLGSYNFTNKARRNAENLALIKNCRFADVHKRVFRSMTDDAYTDENIQLLFEFPLFAQRLISAHYPFNRAQYRKYQSKIINGRCFTYDNGYYDEIGYEPGFIFNPKCRMNRKLVAGELGLPVTKEKIKNWITGRNETLILSGYRDFPDLWDEIGEQLDINSDVVELLFQTMFDHTYNYEELKSLISEELNIIKEDRLWPDNFGLFLNDRLIDQLFDLFPAVQNDYTDHQLKMASRKFKKSENNKEKPSWS